MKALNSFETSESSRPTKRRHITEYYNRQQILLKEPNCRKEENHKTKYTSKTWHKNTALTVILAVLKGGVCQSVKDRYEKMKNKLG
jgi:hypothetical protein